ncbi:MAG: preprotein translocase subunit SecE [Candidatus Pacebacteria bacterium CG10_big_fil_rev_8_21_14_0_10_36_11]|nr:preprotein translocase subunit SecE [Candidatus Pacearchaeota archaeon]OIP73984.1 MAG: preprotein translocase subunit SecE [Candidatus Pacebacteria bacterium CG2_30_36_39]PIR64377.1 MAG: preprotein translocase subunit SecE [Candidatus Pacebacteria bacterium CG10_big_fil_rev_8_21_14_0_10_36_11]PJC43073.1 MAG: preprotein translocase subunit SecE [Candidatus Pacebacteria bacterium CG_4_9_14_0_2_um_filter_36_8]
MQRLLQYFREVIQELKKVSWPTKQKTYELTLLVIGITAAAALYIGGLDYVFARLMSIVLR